MITAPRHVSPPARGPRAVLLGVALWLGFRAVRLGRVGGPLLAMAGTTPNRMPRLPSGHSADCDHCPIRSCGTTAVCSATAVTGLIAYAPVVPWAPLHRVVELRLAAPAGSTSYQPPTPPPQAIASCSRAPLRRRFYFRLQDGTCATRYGRVRQAGALALTPSGGRTDRLPEPRRRTSRFTEDAYPLERYAFELVAPYHFEAGAAGTDAHIVSPGLGVRSPAQPAGRPGAAAFRAASGYGNPLGARRARAVRLVQLQHRECRVARARAPDRPAAAGRRARGRCGAANGAGDRDPLVRPHPAST